ncbi:MAG: hypothetical protein ACO1SX_16745 [Actinomycetota bacterium]
MASVRRIIYAPELCADACLLFSFTSASDRSFRLRHHGPSGSVELGPEHCAAYVTTAWIRSRIRREAVAERVTFEYAGFWRSHLLEYAACWLGARSGAPTFAGVHFPALRPVSSEEGPGGDALGATQFPFLDFDRLRASAKGRKPVDLARMTHSPQSEDYVTWALVCAWRRCRPEWWSTLVQLAAKQAPGLDPQQFGASGPEPPEVRPWLPLASPDAYEQLSRARLAASSDPHLAARATDPRPVEGESEIDLAFVSPAFVVFVEAKLGADLSLSTKYDPSRNQLVRNVDCALEHAAVRPAAVWLFVRDTGPSRLYTSLVDDYRREPGNFTACCPTAVWKK